MISGLILELVDYGVREKLILEDDRICIINKLLELFQVDDLESTKLKQEVKNSAREVSDILNDMLDYAYSKKILKDNTISSKDLFDTRIMGIITPMPSVLRKNFKELYKLSPKQATDYYYSFSKITNYIRMDRIVRDEKWVVNTEYGDIDITINLSKPEKDPRDIAKAGKIKSGGYPSCVLCMENEGFAGNLTRPARQNHRVIPIDLCGEEYYFQYSPYVYYNEHCIVLNKKHIPMRIDEDTFRKLLFFVCDFPHYMVGSNADLPIVGGSILSHDHFQGGRYTFAMAKASYEWRFEVKGYDDIVFGVIKWPMSVIRLQGENIERMVEVANNILLKWRKYSDEKAFIFNETNGTLHNTITPIARKNGNLFELDLVLRNNITTKDRPWGVFHPSADLHHIKKENIGLIEVMGLAILPARLKSEMEKLENAIVNDKDLYSDKDISKHADWVNEWINNYNVTEENIHSIIQQEVGKVFVKVLECSGVFKRTREGKEAFKKFIENL